MKAKQLIQRKLPLGVAYKAVGGRYTGSDDCRICDNCGAVITHIVDLQHDGKLYTVGADCAETLVQGGLLGDIYLNHIFPMDAAKSMWRKIKAYHKRLPEGFRLSVEVYNYPSGGGGIMLYYKCEGINSFQSSTGQPKEHWANYVLPMVMDKCGKLPNTDIVIVEDKHTKK